MSLSEIFDKGAAHPWANLRINNISMDGQIVANNNRYFQLNGALTFNNVNNQTIYTFNLPVGINSAYLIQFTTVFIITAGPNVGKSWCQVSLNSINVASGVVNILANFSNLFTANPSNSISIGIVGQNFNVSGNQVQVRVNNTSPGDTTSVNWNLIIYSITS